MDINFFYYINNVKNPAENVEISEFESGPANSNGFDALQLPDSLLYLLIENQS